MGPASLSPERLGLRRVILALLVLGVAGGLVALGWIVLAGEAGRSGRR
ncbi:hypothetical protein ACFQY5_11715 [Paeniroseomonas aquatica]